MLALLLKFFLVICVPAIGLWFLFALIATPLGFLFTLIATPLAVFIPVYFKMLSSPIWFIMGFFVALLGWNRKLGFWGYFLVSLLLSPLVGFVVVFLADKKADSRQPKLE